MATTPRDHISLRNLRKEFDVMSGVEVAVDDIDLDIEKGEFVTLVGPSGCGKTTTLRCIAGLETATSGTVSIQGADATNTAPQGRDLAMVFQRVALYPHMTVRENIGYPLKLEGVGASERYDQVREAAELVQVSDMLDKYPGDISGGQQQRVSIARAIVRDPVAFLMDEPMSDLDEKLKREMRKELGRLHKEIGETIIYVTHDQREAMTMSDKIAVMNDGHIEQVGAPEEVYRNPNNLFVAGFIGSPEINTLDGSLETIDDERAVVRTDGGTRIEFGVGDYDPERASEDLVVGYRPQHVTVGEPGEGIPADVYLVEPFGDDIHLYMTGPQGEVRSVMPAMEAPSEGDEVGIQFPESALYLFNGETGDRFARGRRESSDLSRIEPAPTLTD
jgi:multiple sugar transport system ATP-binding protein